MKSIVHMSLCVSGALKNKDALQAFTKEDGTQATPDEARAFLEHHQALGHKVIPMDKCEGFSFETGCPGHPIEERKLTAQAQADRDDFNASSSGCSCHINPPCPHCTHPGNPANQNENEDCWEKEVA